MNEGLLVIDLSSRTALVTAAAQGIGRSSVTALAAAGARVIATDINAAALDGFASDAVTPLALDVLDPAAIAAVVGGAGDIDILFNCAGVVHGGALLERSEEHTSELQSLMRISYAAFCLQQHNHPQLIYTPT